MKTAISLILFFCFMGTFAQNIEQGNHRSPKIICKLPIGETAGFGNKSVKFIKVISDSRCPKNVTCVWEGEAKILVEIFENGTKIKQREVIVPSKNGIIRLYSSGNKMLGIFGLRPYPVNNNAIDPSEYLLELIETERK